MNTTFSAKPNLRRFLCSLVFCLPLALSAAPNITSEPTNTTVDVGGTATFTVLASGTGTLRYQWRVNGAGNIGSAATLTLPDVSESQSGDEYTVVVTDNTGSVTSTPPAILTVLNPPVIVSQPMNVVATVGTDAFFDVTANGGAPFYYQWFKNSTSISGATNLDGTFNIEAVADSDAAAYNVVITNTDGSATSSNALLTVVDSDIVGSQPLNLPVNTCTNITLSVITHGTDPNLSYQWFFGTNMTPVGVNSSNLVIADVQSSSAGLYTVEVSTADGSFDYASGTLSVTDPPPVVITQPVTVDLDASGIATITTNQVNNGSYDNCLITNMSVSPSTFYCSNVGPNTVTLYVTDNIGQTSQGTAIVTVEDPVPPVAVFNTISVQLDNTGNYTLKPADMAAIGAGSSDACGITNYSVTPSSFGFCNVGSTNLVTLTVTDANGNQSSINGNLTVLAPVGPPALVVVDTNYVVGSCAVTFPFTNGAGIYYIGYNAYPSIQSGLNAVAPGGVVTVAPEIFNESPVINQAVTLTSIGGTNAANTTIVLQSNPPPTYLSALTINSSSIVVKGFTIVGYDSTGVDAPPTAGLASVDILLNPAVVNIEIANNIIEVGAINTNVSNGDDGFGIETTYNLPGPLANNLNFHNNSFKPVDVPTSYDSPGNAFFINPAGSFDFVSNTITGDLAQSTTCATNGFIAYNTVIGASTNDSSGAFATFGYPDPNLYGRSTFFDNVISNTASGITIYDSENVTVENNLLNGDGVGISIQDTSYDPVYSAGTTVQIVDNSLANDGTGIINTSSNSTPIAVSNWWGDISGPSNPTLNPYGIGSSVSSNLTFIPWLNNGSNSITYGFVPSIPDVAYPPAQLAFTTEPSGANLGSPLTVQPVVQVEDTFGNLTPWANPFVTNTLVNDPDPNAAVAGTNPQQAVGGVATFTDLSVQGSGGSNLALVASAAYLPPATSTSFNVTNPAPGISSVNPFFARAGGPNLTITVTGSNFVGDSVVYWGNMALTTTYLSSTQLTAIVPAIDITETNTVEITVENFGPGGGTTGELAFQVDVATPPVVYVDSRYTGVAMNTLVDWPYDTNTGPHIIGYDAFATIQGGVNNVAASGTVNVAAGTYSESVTAGEPVTLLGANQGIAGCAATRGPESVVSAGSGNAITIGATNVVVDGFELSGGVSVYDAGYAGSVVQNNIMNATGAGVQLIGIATTAGSGCTLQNNCITLGSQVVNDNTPTVGIGINTVTGTQAPLILSNNISGAFYGYLLYGLNAAAPTVVQYSSITGVMQGVSVLNIDPLTLTNFSSSTFGVDGVTVSGFSGSYPLLESGNDFHAGVYAFTDGTLTSATLTGVVTNVTVIGTSNISSDSSGLYFTDFSTGSGLRQQITVQDCNVISNQNRGVFVSGSNAVAVVSGSSILGNGFNPYGTGNNYGFGIIARNNAQVTVSNCFIVNPPTVTGPYTVRAVEADANTGPLGPTLVVTDCSILNNGNSAGYLAGQDSGTLNASGNWWGTTSDTDIASLMLGVVDFTPYLDNGTDTDPVTPGFQGDFSALHVTTLGAQIGGTGRIQEGINDVVGGKVIIEAGNYAENILANKDALELAGVGQSLVTIVPAFSAPAPCPGDGSICAGASIVILVQANDVTIHDLTVDGQMGARDGIIEDYNSGVFNNTVVYNTTVQNIWLRGIYASSGGTGFFFHDNIVSNVQADPESVAMFNFGGSGIMSNNVVSAASDALSANWSTGTQFLNNTVSNSASAVHTDNSSGPDVISGNSASVMQPNAYGFWVFAPYGNIVIENNTASSCAVGLASAGQSAATTPLFINNQVTAGSGVGSIGAYETTSLFGFGYTNVSSAFEGNTIQGTTYGFYLEDQSTNNFAATITQDNVVTGNQYGVYATGSPESVKIENTDLRNNSTAAIYATGGATVDAGKCGADVTGLGASAGGNVLTGYLTGSALAIVNTNSGGSPAVYAYNDSFGATALQPEISSAFSGNVLASQAAGLLALPPAPVGVQCVGEVPTATNTLAGFGGVVSATAATVSSVDGPLTPGPFDGTIIRTYTLTDACGQNTSVQQTITVQDTTPPTVTSWPPNQTLDVNGQCNVAVPALTNEVVEPFDNCGAVTVTQNPPVGTLVSLGTTNVTVTVTDQSGNSISNIVVLTVIDTQSPPAATYVDAAYTGMAAGTVVTWPATDGSGTHYVGCDAFPTIQGGIDRVASAGTVNVAAGTYAENVLVNKSATVLGPNANIDPNTGSRVAEAIVMPATTETSVQSSTSGTIFRVGTNSSHVNVTIKGFELDGHNPNLSGGITYNEVMIDTGAGIVNSTDSFDANPGSFDTIVVVQNNIFQNLERYGVLLDTVPATTPTAGNDVSDNKFDNLPSGDNFNGNGNRGRAVAFEDNTYGTCIFNVMTRVDVGWQDDNYYLPSPGAGTLVASNTISTYRRGIFHNLQYEGATPAMIVGNNISVETNGDFPASTNNFGIEFASIQSGVSETAIGNNVTNNVYGIMLWNVPTTGSVVVSGGTLSGNTYGVWATSNDPQFNQAAGSSNSVVSGVTVLASTGAGIFVDDSMNFALTRLTVTSNTVVSGAPVGVLVSGTNAAATVVDNSASITGNGIGISVDGGAALVQNNDLTGNTIAGINAINSAIVDAGNCTGTNFTGLGSSTGGNNLSGYGFVSAAPWAIINGNPGGSPIVLADHDNFGAVVGDNIPGAFSGPVEYSQSPAVIGPPTNVTVVCVSDVPVPLTTLSDFIAFGGYYSASAGTVSSSDNPSIYSAGSQTIVRTYTITDGCGLVSTSAVQTITVSDTIPPVFTVVPTNIIVPVDHGQTNASDVMWVAEATDNCAVQSIVSNPTNGSTFPEGVTTVTVTATDTSGNQTVTNFTVEVVGLPQITQQPVSRTNNAGTTATFSVAATSPTPLGYLWEKSGHPLNDGTNISGSTSSTLVIASVSDGDVGSYSVSVSNIAGAVLSSNATLTVIDPPVIATQPVSVTNNATTTAAFAVTVNGTSPFGYQWYKDGTNQLVDGGNISGSISNILTLSNVLAADRGLYSVVVTNPAGVAVSTNATLAVVDPWIDTQPVSATEPLGGTVTFSVGALGTTPLTYVWQQNNVVIPDATNSSYTIGVIRDSDAGAYNVIVSGPGGTVTSSNATLTVTHPPVFATEPQNQTVVQGQTASFNVTMNGTSPFTYQWQFNSANIPGATSHILTLNNVAPAQAGNYDVLVTNADGFAISTQAVLTVIVPPSFVTQPTSITNNAGTTATFSVAASGTALNYQWFKNGTNQLTDAGNVSGSGTAMLTLNNVLGGDAGAYSVEISNLGGSLMSSNATLTVIDPVITNEPTNVGAVLGTPASFSVGVAGTSPTYQWRKDGTAIGNATNSTYSLAAVVDTNAGGYDVIVTTIYGSVTSTPPAALTVFDPALVTVGPASITRDAGATATFTVTATGTAPLGYQWFEGSSPLADGGRIMGSLTNTLTISMVNDSDVASYYCVVTNAYGTNASSSATLTVIDPPVITNQPVSITNNATTTATFTVGVSGTAPLSYQWYKNGTNQLVDGGNVLGSTSNILTLSDVLGADRGDYSVIVTNAAGSATSSNATLSVIDPVITLQPANITAIDGSTISFSVTAVGTAQLHYQWREDDVDLEDGFGITGSGTSMLTISNVADSDQGNYSVVITNSEGVATSVEAVLTTVPPLIVFQPTNAYVLVGQPFSFSVEVNGVQPFSYQWVLNNTNINGATSRIYSVAAAALSDAGSYYVIVSNTNGTETSATATLQVFTNAFSTLTFLGRTNGNASIELQGIPTLTYQLQATTNLSTTNWESLETNASPFIFIDTNQFPLRFYRGLYAP